MSKSLSPEERRLRAQLAAHAMHAKHDARAFGRRTQQVLLAKLELEVDPDSALPVEERQRRARQLRKSLLTRIAFERVKKQREAREREAAEEEATELTLLASAKGRVAEGGA